MCQLLGMNCNVPTDICFSFQGFSRRAGVTDEHVDGFGIAFFEGRGVRTFLDERSAATSPVAALIKTWPIRSKNVVAHIRKATRGAVALENCHPFQRELWGRYWLFAHNGTLDRWVPPEPGRYRPVGATDSEAAFCLILDRLHSRFGDTKPPLGSLVAELRAVAGELAALGTFNFLLSDGEQLFAHAATNLHYIVREAPFRRAHLLDEDVEVDFAELAKAGDRVAVVATLPLTDDESWTPLEPGRLLVFEDGRPLDR